jgi:AcrR family transcriptional regulator
MKESQQIWITAGYEMFAIHGETGLKVETLAKKAGISKSSFYHHFADTAIFLETLLSYHLVQVKILAAKENAVQQVDPELIHILIEHKTDLLFNRQLRFHSHNNTYKSTLEKSNRIIGKDFVHVWKNDLQLNLSIDQLLGIFELALENFFLQINPENINYQWLSNYFAALKVISRKLDADTC